MTTAIETVAAPELEAYRSQRAKGLRAGTGTDAARYPDTSSSAEGSTLRSSRIEARDRRLAALHEAGHAVLARETGMLFVTAEIWRSPDLVQGYPTWDGRTNYADPLPKGETTKRQMIAVAGLVAVNLYLGRRSVRSSSGLDSLSTSDLAMAEVERNSEGAISAPDIHRLAHICQSVETAFLEPAIRKRLLTTARRLILRATGRYEGPLFDSLFAA